MARLSTAGTAYFITLSEAIDHFAADLFGPEHPDRAAVVRTIKAGFTRRQLTSTSREFVLSTMLDLMQTALAAVVRKGEIDTRRFSPEVRALINGHGDRRQVEQYLRNAQRTA